VGGLQSTRRAALVLLVALAAPTALAATLDLSTRAPVGVDATVAAHAAGGSLLLRGDGLTLDARLAGVRGNLTLYTWERASAAVVGSPLPPAQVRAETHRLDGGDVLLHAAGEAVELRVAAQGGHLAVEGEPLRGEGRPAFLARAYRDRPDAAPAAGDAPERVPIAWEAGWAFVGDFGFEAGARVQGFPVPPAPRLAATGALDVQAFGGNVTFTDAEGRTRTVALGNVARERPLLAGEAEVRTVRRLVLHADDARVAVPLAGEWGLAAPALSWRVDGTLRFADATGRAEVEGRWTSFADADVRVDLDGRVDPAPGALALDPDAYAAQGEVRSLRVDGRDAAPAAARRVAPAAAAALPLAALALLAATKAGQALLAHGAAALYTRLSPGRVLSHPTRARIVRVVDEEPGIHQRELHRRSGVAWGAFAFHLRTLEKAGHLRRVRAGPYVAVVPASARDSAPPLPHPVARAVYDALPQDGGPIPLADVVAKVGRSRELVSYHLRGLEERGLARRTVLEDGRRGVERVPRAQP